MLKLDIPLQLLITGYRGVGKTFLIRNVLQDQDDDILSIFIDISKIHGQEKGKLKEEEVLKEILNGINESIFKNSNSRMEKIRKRIENSFKSLRLKNYEFSTGADIFDIPIPVITDNYSELSKFVIELPQNIVDSNDDINGFIIAIDEFQLLKNLENPDAFFWLIRSSTQRQFNVSYIFTGSISQTSDIVGMVNGPDGAFGGRLIQINIRPFSEEETKAYIAEKAEGLSFTEEGFKRFYACTRGIPLNINAFSSILPRNVPCDEKIIKEGLNLNIDQVAVVWVYVWGRLSSGEKEFIIYLLEHDNAFRKDLDVNLPFSRSSISRFISSLSNKGIIGYDSNRGYYIIDNLLATWLKIQEQWHLS